MSRRNVDSWKLMIEQRGMGIHLARYVLLEFGSKNDLPSTRDRREMAALFTAIAEVAVETHVARTTPRH